MWHTSERQGRKKQNYSAEAFPLKLKNKKQNNFPDTLGVPLRCYWFALTRQKLSFSHFFAGKNKKKNFIRMARAECVFASDHIQIDTLPQINLLDDAAQGASGHIIIGRHYSH